MKLHVLLLGKLAYFLAGRGCFRHIPDELYLKCIFYLRTGKKIDFNCPKTFSEKINWLKIHDRNPYYTKLVDKYEVKQIVGEIIGESHIIPTYGVWNTFDEVDFNSLPKEFVLKCTHDSGSVVIIRDKDNVDKAELKKHFEECMSKRIYDYAREWAYRDVSPRIIAEKYMFDESGVELKDYKLFTFNGKAKIIQVDFNRFSGHKRLYYSREWEKLELSILIKSSDKVIQKPRRLEQMIKFAEEIAKNTKFLRVDFYVNGDEVFFGEATFYPGSGFEKIEPIEWDYKLGSWIEI